MEKGLIYVDQISERIKYIETVFFVQRLIPISFTNDIRFFKSSEDLKLNYSDLEIDGCQRLKPATLLWEESVREVDLSLSDWNHEQILAFDGIPDPLATVFYFISRYEEYLPSVKDVHNRYLAENSVLNKLFDIKKQNTERVFNAFLLNCFQPFYSSYRKSVSSLFVPTFDIDNTFAFQWKEGWRSWVSNLKDTVQGNKTRKELRKKVQNKEMKDPYDAYAEIKSVLSKHQGMVFWLLGDLKKYDKNIAWNNPHHQRLIRDIADYSEIGLHPSYASNMEHPRLEMEKHRLEKILTSQVVSSRQHFLKLEIPVTYERLIARGFKHDYSLGYAETVGFRAGTAHPFLWFNLQQNCTTTLCIHPFAYMDGTLNEYMKLSISEAKSMVNQLISEVKTYGGEFSFLWHNESFSENGIWQNWREVYTESEQFWNENSN